ncbi:oxidoreductase [Mycolicibacterium chitae]|uniref:Clavaldehyde dehydrogenase n=1 Tax=Mycolicibacterium chitae TaxID=1792 RepID=A0A448I932_MYCCI|nr:SDR family oxidoreductase [Mycolicibacterium chitae]MCV7106220.1 SDR family oxidoreductase [Mycolicibacterium chitae]BBZ05325.1 oxidoreductase [Mycolicibacterium chitae]VEG48945.1 clavaldehyde dehydrogenase [Mycolicibacterium chitae]
MSELRDAAGLRILIVGASSGIGHAVARRAAARGATVAVAARRVELLTELAESIGGTAFELDVQDAKAIEKVVPQAVESLGGSVDAVLFTSTVVPFAYIEDTDVATWLHAYAVNALGANYVLRASLPHLSEDGVVLITSSREVGRPRAGVAAYDASKAALDEILNAWRSEHPDLSLIRVGMGPTEDTEILRGADRDLLEELFKSWVEHGQLPAQMSELDDVANTLVSLVTAAYANPSVVPEIVQLSPRIRKRPSKEETGS